MKNGYFYFISDSYYEKFNNEPLMANKEFINGEEHNRPCYYAFNDEKDNRIFWMIPVSSQIDKYSKYYEKAIKKYGRCDGISFGYIKGEYNAFLLQNMCPVTSQYILNQYFYVDSKEPIEIPNKLKKELNAKARKILRLTESGKQLTFTNILKIRKTLIDELQ